MPSNIHFEAHEVIKTRWDTPIWILVTKIAGFCTRNGTQLLSLRDIYVQVLYKQQQPHTHFLMKNFQIFSIPPSTPPPSLQGYRVAPLSCGWSPRIPDTMKSDTGHQQLEYAGKQLTCPIQCPMSTQKVTRDFFRRHRTLGEKSDLCQGGVLYNPASLTITITLQYESINYQDLN